MAKISKSDDGKRLLVDGEPLDGVAVELSDEDLAAASGGVQVDVEHHWYGSRYLVCECKSSDFDIIGTNGTNVLSCKCKKCGIVYWDVEIK